MKTLDDAIERLTVLRDEMAVRQEEMDKALAEMKSQRPAPKPSLEDAIRTFFGSLVRR
ncbi:hypothetical protein MOP88_14350 [Sphingomonas sp. WKB10]|nr:hypothetical protein [Sphingomonas sp. WKB10]